MSAGCSLNQAGLFRFLMSDNRDIMSDMASQRLTVRIPANLGTRIRDKVRSSGQTPSDLVRVALEHYLQEQAETRSAYDVAKAAGLIGVIRRGPGDLSTNKKYFERFGKGK